MTNEQRRDAVQRIASSLTGGEYDTCDETYAKSIIALNHYADWARQRWNLDTDRGVRMDSSETGKRLFDAIETALAANDCAVTPDQARKAGMAVSTAVSHTEMAEMAEAMIDTLRDERYGRGGGSGGGRVDINPESNELQALSALDAQFPELMFKDLYAEIRDGAARAGAAGADVIEMDELIDAWHDFLDNLQDDGWVDGDFDREVIDAAEAAAAKGNADAVQSAIDVFETEVLNGGGLDVPAETVIDTLSEYQSEDASMAARCVRGGTARDVQDQINDLLEDMDAEPEDIDITSDDSMGELVGCLLYERDDEDD